ncbi:hypothetical protein IEQ34_002346 [Dendrobium chrysotoxum]|uniref:Uncharacterized protein n=1 Tax=Dendrobium chrysotoxum TaxID=161865 RepID=A0AAV7HMX1_DENCH|nr:hypothetical protein IEQ34_002346 [Dendrobium chrysotoxum]
MKLVVDSYSEIISADFTRAQGNDQYMLAAMKDVTENIDLILDSKRKNNKFVGNTQGRFAKLKDLLKCRPKGISNARLRGHWEKNKKHKSKI